jgi:hypothetical protein
MIRVKIGLAVLLLAACSLVAADRAEALGLELEGRWWPTSVSGSAGLENLDIEIPSDIDVTSLLNLEADDVFELRGTFRAFLGFYIRAAYQQMNHSGSLNLGDELNLPIDISSSINSGVDFDYARLALGWRFVFPEKIFSIGVFAEAKAFSGDAFISLDTPFFEDSASESFEAALPSVGAVVEIWPVEKFQLYGEASFEVGYDDGNMMDAEFAARYYPVKVLGLGLGYRIITIDAVIDNVVLDVDSKGFFLSGVLTF